MRYLPVITFFCLLTMACHKKNDDDNIISAQLNGKTISGSTNNATITKQDINTTKYSLSTRYVISERNKILTFHNVQLKTGKQELHSNMLQLPDSSYQWLGTDTASISFYTDYGDYTDEDYILLDGADNFLDIESYNSNNGRVKATFQFTMIAKRRYEYNLLPGTIKFTNGLFDVTLE